MDTSHVREAPTARVRARHGIRRGLPKSDPAASRADDGRPGSNRRHSGVMLIDGRRRDRQESGSGERKRRQKPQTRLQIVPQPSKTQSPLPEEETPGHRIRLMASSSTRLAARSNTPIADGVRHVPDDGEVKHRHPNVERPSDPLSRQPRSLVDRVSCPPLHWIEPSKP